MFQTVFKLLPESTNKPRSEINIQNSSGLVGTRQRAASCVGTNGNSITLPSNFNLYNSVENSNLMMNERYTLPVENPVMGQMMESVLACQHCKGIFSRIKQLQCFHTVCQNCVTLLQTKKDTDYSELQCEVCGEITTWNATENDDLLDIRVMERFVNKSSRKNRSILSNENNGCITMYGDQDLTINIVSYNTEKIEIKTALEAAQQKIQMCNKQTKQVEEYETSVNEAKKLLQRQILQATNLFKSAIDHQQKQLMDELKEALEKDLQPVIKAKQAIEVQMQSLQLVTQCCSVANRILESGGAPLDLNNFKKMVWDTMKKSEQGKLPKSVEQRYKCSVYFKNQDYQYEKFAEKMGALAIKQSLDKTEPRKAKNPITKQIHVSKENQSQPTLIEEPIYDVPPEEYLYASSKKKKSAEAADECLYDQIPFFDETLSENMNSVNSLNYNTEFYKPQMEQPNLSHDIAKAGSNTLTRAVEIVTSRRRAVYGEETDSGSASDDSFSSDCFSVNEMSKTSYVDCSEKDNSCQYLPAPSETASTLVNEHQENANKYETSPNNWGGTMSKILRRKRSLRALVNCNSDQLREISTPNNKLLFSIGRAKKTAYTGEDQQQFGCLPEFVVDSDDTIWINDTQNHRVQFHEGRAGKLAGVFKTSIHGVSLKPKGIAAPLGGKKIAVSCGKYATVWTDAGELIRQVGPHPDFGKLGGMVYDASGNLILADIENTSVIITRTASVITNVSTAGTVLGKTSWQGRIAINSLNQLVIPDYKMHCVNIYKMSGVRIKRFGTFGVGPGQVRYPSAVAIDQHDRIYVADECNNRVSLFSSDGESFIQQILTKDDGISFPHAISVFSDGAVAVGDDSRLVKVYSWRERPQC